MLALACLKMPERSGLAEVKASSRSRSRRQRMLEFVVRLLLPSKKEKEKESSMKALQGKSGVLRRHSKQTSRILQKVELFSEQLLLRTMELEKEIIRALERNKISPKLLVSVEEAKALGIRAEYVLGKMKKTGSHHLHFEELVDLYFELIQKLEIEEDVKFSIELSLIRNIEHSWQSPNITEKSSSKNEKLQRRESEQNPPSDLSAAPSEMEVVSKLPQVKEAKNDHDAGSIRLSPCIQEERESAQFPELSEPGLEDEIVSAPCPSQQIEFEVITAEVEIISPLEQVNSRSSSSQSDGKKHPNDNNQEPNPTDTPPAAYEIEGDISSGAERGKMGPIPSTSIKSPMLIPISVQGELSPFMEITLEILYAKRKWQNASNGFKNCNFVSGKENYHVLAKTTSPHVLEHLIFKSEGDRMTNPPDEDKWKQAGVMLLTDDACPSLPEKPDSPNLVLLFLQRNPCLRLIPDSFFSAMHALRVVDLSDNRIRSLPSSLLGLHKLQVFILRNCNFIYSLPPEIKGLESIEVLDLLGTELESVPDELGHLIKLKHLQISFYGTDDDRERDHLPSNFLSPETISKLQHLKALSIVVHPEDLRWERYAEAIIQGVWNLEDLSYLDLYFPKAEILEHFIEISLSWERISSNKFKFVVGQNVKRIVDRVSGDVEQKFNEQDRCLRFVNGNNVPPAIAKVLKHTTAFYLDHHSVICSLSEFGIIECNQLNFCVVRECPNVEVIISDEIDEPAFPCLEYLGLHYLWKLDSICRNQLPERSFFALKSLTVDTCPKLEYIFSESLFQYFCNLEELVVEDCESLKEIIEKSDKMGSDAFSALPCLRKVKLYYLPQLLRFWWEWGEKFGGSTAIERLPT